MGKEGLDRSAREALALFEQAKRDKENHAGIGIPVAPMRVKLAEHIDLSKASKGCERCKGTGIVGKREVDASEGQLDIPIICRCVVKGGGVKEDKLDKLVDELVGKAKRKRPVRLGLNRYKIRKQD